MPFFNRNSHVQADFIPEGDELKAAPYGDRVAVKDNTDESAVSLAEKRSIALTDGVVSGPDAIDPSEKGAAEVKEVKEDVVAVEGPEPKTGQPEDPKAEDAGDLPRTDEGVIEDFVPDESDPTPEPLPEGDYDVTDVIEDREDEEDAKVEEFAEKAAEAEKPKPKPKRKPKAKA
jgi:hypothetical protein